MEGVAILPHLGVEQEQYRENLKPSDQHEEGKNGQGWARYDLDLWDLSSPARVVARGYLVANGPVAQLVRASDS